MASKRTTNMGMNDWIGSDGIRRDEMSVNFQYIDSEFEQRGISVKWYGAVCDGIADDTQALINAFGKLKDGDTLVFPKKGRCKTNVIGFLATVSKKNITVLGNDCVIQIEDQGLGFTNCRSLRVSRLQIERRVQAPWGAGKTGVYIYNTVGVDFDRNEVSKFTDAVSFTSCTNVRAYKNVMHDLGEEPFAARVSKNVIIEENEAFNYLGDGVLNKGTEDMSVIRNYLHCENTKTSNLALWNALSGANPAAPVQGGGVTSNVEDGNYNNLNMTIDDNRIYSTIYGIILSGVTVAKIINNRIKNVGVAAGIALSDSATYNPGKVGNYDVIIAHNHIDNLLNPGPQYGIYVKTGAVLTDRVQIGFNTVRPVGPHKGISASGKAHLFGNTVDKCEIGIELFAGAKATGNTVLDSFVTEYGRAMSLYDNAIAINNTINSSTSVLLWGSGATFSNNEVMNTGVNVWAVYVTAGAVGNTVKDNIISSAGLKEAAGADADWKDKNVYSGWLDRAGVKTYIPQGMPRYASRPTTAEAGRITGAPIFDTTIGLPVVWNNTRWVEANYGRVTMSGDGVTKFVQIPHGLYAAPLICTATASTKDAGTARIGYVDADAVNITVHFDNPMPAGTNNIVLYWEAKNK
ncbi:right-handed parallel beta-helix repeat-containing protein [Paenibacillus sp. P22]|uniref:right-handed parallel beta-helix repeat-containing protein n=1 Tax=Paenibacillus sp. P22 TaxID=483908 RepID=UPI00038F5E34|nr:right-handed parallel beta-helix repeat-containing protein [Paenibacillus sp. P22]CDN41179.1 Putative uncharacterized protein [Paenibacillus sp. P22]